jgi:uncharacterized protein YdhG (YjbR/CyaY superfamily)
MATFESYVEAIPPEQGALFDRLHALIVQAHPDAEVAMSYDMPAYRLSKRRLSLGVWKHGVSVYGWRRDNDGGFADRHPELASGKSTLRIRPSDAEGISDQEFTGLLGGALDP